MIVSIIPKTNSWLDKTCVQILIFFQKMITIGEKNYNHIMTLVRLPCQHLQHLKRIKHMTACPKCGAGGLENLQKAIKIIMNNDPIPVYRGKRPREVPFKMEVFIYIKPNIPQKLTFYKHFDKQKTRAKDTNLLKIRLIIKIELRKQKFTLQKQTAKKGGRERRGSHVKNL